ncbi:unnamed protein product [Zymoseptoria tritici ST99CH_3D1]|uniref:Uncharacterized protein n=1 Tax=Zymoseptoria tritici ST99CH_1E4 TaxID=1276532 RepID=A0A2H1FYF7_ZYMTR|nr:unnamed protein product [Zymoseptoria tritici ST99CH_1E4]SMR47598.1 unnamed protein product [Zymoseptoria tritici ST99CH_3D1]
MSYFSQPTTTSPKVRRIRDLINRQASLKANKNDSNSSFYRLTTQSSSGYKLPMQIDHKPKLASQPSLIEELETKTRFPITIGTSPRSASLAKCDWQQQSPLFQLPQELRRLIFEFATSSHDDPNHNSISGGRVAAQSGRFKKQRVSTSLLRTCRRAWLEANALPLRNFEHRFWFCSVYSDAGQEWTKLSPADEDARLWKLLTTFTPNNRRNFEHLRLFASMWWLENKAVEYLPILLGVSGACPRVLTITVRHTDLWLVEEGRGIDVREEWLQRLLNAPSLERLQEIRLEVEALDDTPRQAILGSRAGVVELAVEKYRAVRTEARLTESGNLRQFELRNIREEIRKSGVEDLDIRLAKVWPKGFHLDYRSWTLVWKAADASTILGTPMLSKHREDAWIKRAMEQHRHDGEHGAAKHTRAAMMCLRRVSLRSQAAGVSSGFAV